MTVKVHVFKPGTNLRRGGATRGPNNVIKVIGIGHYEALYQSPGQDVKEGDDVNFWWVKIIAGADQGWVSAVRIATGGNNQPIPGVEQRPAVYC
jgi:hypothetical protein